MGQSDAMSTAHQDQMWPRWVPIVAAAFSLAIALIAPFAHNESTVVTPVVVLLVLAAMPWVVEAVLFETSGRMIPQPIFAAAVYIPLAIVNLGGGAFGVSLRHDAQLSFMLLTLAAGELAARTEPRTTPIYAGIAVLMPFARYLVEPQFVEWVFWSAGILLATGAGLLLQRQNALVRQLRAAQAALADEAALQERRRIAREVHDVIAHSLTVAMLHITAARLAVRRDQGEAEAALAEAERLGRQALGDVRRTVGLLHGGGHRATDAPLPTAADLPALVESYVAAGADVRFECTADLDAVTPAGGLALYRAVQESLANAAKHAPGTPVTVTVAQKDSRITVDVANATAGAPAAGGAGMGLRGMQERIEAVGGTVVSGPNGPGWVTSCAIPVQTAP